MVTKIMSMQRPQSTCPRITR